PDFSVADLFCQGEAYEPEQVTTSQSKFVAVCLCGGDDVVRLVAVSFVTSGLSNS
ncbi:MAG: hypothetical protein K0R44_2102, partial [Thermomicrobiales bacterium]|nr:hypothetical protein [Thermomicrobiales bacterium]